MQNSKASEPAVSGAEEQNDVDRIRKAMIPTPMRAKSPSDPSKEIKITNLAEREQPLLGRDVPSLLLVDDNLINLKVVARYAKKCGIKNPTLCSGGEEAIQAFKLGLDSGNAYQCCFMDLSMPRISGFEATLAIRELEKQARATSGDGESHMKASIIALTGLVSAKDRRAAFDAGVDQYITKPADIKSIQGALAAWRQSDSRAYDDRT